MKVILFTDAHISTEGDALLVSRFLDEKSNVYFLGDMFDDPRDIRRWGRYISRYDFTWIKGNHDYWLDLPEEIDLGDVLLTHGHTKLITSFLERYMIRYTPLSMKLGLFGPAMGIGKLLRDSSFEKLVGRVVLNLSYLARRFNGKPIIMGHLHHFLQIGNVTVLPRFPYYAVLTNTKLEIRNFLNEI